MHRKYLSIMLVLGAAVLAAATTPSAKWMQFDEHDQKYPICNWLEWNPSNPCACHMINGIPKCLVGNKFECIQEPERKDCDLVCGFDYVTYFNVEFAAYVSCTEDREIPLAWYGRCLPHSNWDDLKKECDDSKRPD